MPQCNRHPWELCTWWDLLQSSWICQWFDFRTLSQKDRSPLYYGGYTWFLGEFSRYYRWTYRNTWCYNTDGHHDCTTDIWRVSCKQISLSTNAYCACSWHGDIRPANIIIKKRAYASVYDFESKITGFGLSHFKQYTSAPDKLTTSTTKTTSDFLGTRAYGKAISSDSSIADFDHHLRGSWVL